MSHHPADDAPEAGRRRAAHAALERAAAAHWAQAGALLGEADTAYGRIARFSDDEDQAVANDASVEAHAADVQAAERTADAGVLRAMAANLYSPSAPHGPTPARAAAARPRPAARSAPAQPRNRPRAGR